MSETCDTTPSVSAADAARAAGFAAALALYAALAAASTVIFPPLGAAFLLPPLIAIVAVAPALKAAPRTLALSLLSIAAFLLAVWPVYLFVKLGPLPILTPPRLVLYAVSALWAYDMTFSRLRRAQFAFAVRKSGAVSAAVFVFFLLGLLSLPFAEGRSISIPEFVRQLMIWFVPYCAVLTYCRRQRDFVRLLKAFAAGAFVVALIAICEAATHRLLADLLSPFISDDAEWLRNAQAEKIRDGAFRAQASHTHPLSLGEHLALSAPFALAFLVGARKIRSRLFWAAAFLAIALAAVATHSRGAMLVMSIAVLSMAAVLAFRFLKRAHAAPFRPLAALVLAGALLVSPLATGRFGDFVSGKGGMSQYNSSQSRLDQIEQAWPKIMKRPIGGYGTGRATRVLGYWGRTLTIDDYYLTLALDLGLLGPLAFLAMLIAWGAAAMRRFQASHASLGVIYLACAASALSIAVSRMVSSQTGNLAILFVVMAAFAGASVTFSRRKSRNRL